MIHKNKGFTLIELLVVISIIALLSSIVMSSVVSARDKARRTAYHQSARQFQLALDLYKSNTGYYPCEYSIECQYYNGSDINDFFANTTVPPVTPTYIGQFPIPAKIPDAYYYMGMDYAISSNFAALRCGNKPVKGYLLIYWDMSYVSDLDPVPRLNDNGNPAFGWCLTAD